MIERRQCEAQPPLKTPTLNVGNGRNAAAQVSRRGRPILGFAKLSICRIPDADGIRSDTRIRRLMNIAHLRGATYVRELLFPSHVTGPVADGALESSSRTSNDRQSISLAFFGRYRIIRWLSQPE